MLASELTRLGYAAVDADEQIAHWEIGPDGRRWMWDRGRLERAIEQHAPGPLFVCGIAQNQRDMLDLFDQVFLLSMDHATRIDRLTASADRGPALWEPIIDGLPVFEAEMREIGATVLDARLSPSVLAADHSECASLTSRTRSAF